MSIQYKALVMVNAEPHDPEDTHYQHEGKTWVIDVSRRAKSKEHAIQIIKECFIDQNTVGLVEIGSVFLAVQTIKDWTEEITPISLLSSNGNPSSGVMS